MRRPFVVTHGFRQGQSHEEHALWIKRRHTLAEIARTYFWVACDGCGASYYDDDHINFCARCGGEVLPRALKRRTT